MRFIVRDRFDVCGRATETPSRSRVPACPSYILLEHSTRILAFKITEHHVSRFLNVTIKNNIVIIRLEELISILLNYSMLFNQQNYNYLKYYACLLQIAILTF